MADIGSKLRETRIRNKIDITTVEQATKIRAKYLRALENEEWRVLPGPTYVKTFLRTYAQFLGLDPHLLVEEYSARYEVPEELELPAFTRETRLPERVRGVGAPSRWAMALALLVAFLGFLLVLGLTGNEGGKGTGKRGGTAQRHSKRGPRHASAGAPAPQKPREQVASGKVRLTVLAARPVWVCLVDEGGRARIDGVTLAVGQREGPFTSRSFKITVGNGGGDLEIDGVKRDTPDRAEPLGYLVRSGRASVLPADERPTCG